MSKPGSIGDRMKRYEAAYAHKLTPRSCLIVRVDGRAFHSYTRGMAKPFSPDLMRAMDRAARRTSEQMQGFKLAYVQSDECTFLLTDFDDLTTQGWFDYDLSKVISISASAFTLEFNDEMGSYGAQFDSRAFIVPFLDAANVFVWRQRDWERNSVQMLARHHFSHKELHQKGIPEIHEMLHAKGVNWAHRSPREKNGAFVTGDGEFVNEKLTYDEIMALAFPPLREVEFVPQPSDVFLRGPYAGRKISDVIEP